MMISENQDSLNRESVITAYALTKASRNSLSAAGNVRVLLRGGTRIRTSWNKYGTIVSRHLSGTSFESRQIADTDPVPGGIRTQVHCPGDLFQPDSPDGIYLEHFSPQNTADFLQQLTFPQRDQVARLSNQF